MIAISRVHAHIHTHIPTHTHTHTHTYTNTHTHTRTHRHDAHTDAHSDAHTYTQTHTSTVLSGSPFSCVMAGSVFRGVYREGALASGGGCGTLGWGEKAGKRSKLENERKVKNGKSIRP